MTNENERTLRCLNFPEKHLLWSLRSFFLGTKICDDDQKIYPRKLYFYYSNELKYKEGKCLTAKENTQNCYA